ncbi:macrophage colony-stimulating factor 1 receptor isoform X1 [Danio rerio]|uniref:receptor protein-tyrosine kinase n=2 Tax=Danio rerio TaxID=7955 RepID=A0A8M9QKN6_DANRE|nr:macrophage colony-stimulating factor 1 receptor isoform X1 [Danio rerio]XP_021336732.1 macrophage colony-stimulating factor 1 receptor isoform X1 [Danio rerio]|eukprot:XP_021336731.1 macrophage colony-stimulating factor 1 receptor isoform X1 [Danio rerio]
MFFMLLFLIGILLGQVQGWSEPRIRLSSGALAGTDVILESGSPLQLVCEGDGPVTFLPRLAKHKRYISKEVGKIRSFRVEKTTVDFTGTYKCVYMNGNDSNLSSSVHVFVRDSRVLFVSPSTSLRYVRKEGEDLLLPCLLTDPEATDFTFRMDNGSAAPYGMNITYDPRKGVLIRNVHPGFNADYICCARIGGAEKVSKIFSINIIQRLRFPPYVYLKRNEYVKLVGERLQISCTTNNPNFYYNVTWTHSSRMLPKAEEKSTMEGDRLAIESILTIPSVQLSHTGNITCTGQNEAGANSSTTHLLVVEEPYIRLSPKLSSKLTHRGLSIEVSEGDDVDLGVLIEAYPPLTSHKWETPTSHNASLPENRFFNHNDRYEALLLLKRLNFEEIGQYTLNVKNSMKSASITFDIKMYTKPVARVKWENVTTLSCRSYGYPAPSILWYQCTGIRTTCPENTTDLQPIQTQTVEFQKESFGAVGVESVLTVGPNRRMTVVCVAFNLVGQGSDTFSMEVSDQIFTSAMCGSTVAMVVLGLLLIFMIYKYKQKPRYEIRWKIIEATNGNNYTFIDPTQLPYNEKWEFPRDKLKLGKTLGAGAFGKVVEATAYGLGKEDNITRVAVKMLKASAHPDEREALMSELKILSHLGQHKNIVNLLGACTHGGPVLVITEYCCHGDLLNFLRSKAENFLNFVMTIPNFPEPMTDYKNVSTERMFVRSDSGISSTCSDHYLDMRPVTSRPTNSALDSSSECQEDSWPLDMDDLLRFSSQVAQGLDFLAAKNCIHRDVAARNVLLTNSRVAKICDFGLARDIMNDSNYVVKGNARLPVKWMAPESIFECVYTVQSDVWSYGIMLWEIFSLGKSPYPNILVDSKFYKMIKCGYQMSRPDFAPPEMYTIMKMCWNLDAAERPTFSKISQMIQRMLGETSEQQDTQEYKNIPTEAEAEQQLESCDPVKHEDESFETSCDQEEEDQPLMKPNNYQFC